MNTQNMVTIGLAGAGTASRLHGHAYLKVSGLQIRFKTICDLDETKAKMEAERFGYERYCTDFQQMLEDPEIDVIDICTPPFIHADMIIKALEAGKHVICEKPLTGYFGQPGDIEPIGETVSRKKMLDFAISEMDRIKIAVEKTDKLFMYAENYVYAPTIQKASEVIRAKKSKILFMRGEESHRGSQSIYAKTWKATGGGALIRIGCHPLSGILWLKREEAKARGETITVQRVSCTTSATTKVLTDPEKRHLKANPVDVEDVATVTITFSDGSVGLVIAADVCMGGTTNYVNVYANDVALICHLTPPNTMRSYMLDEEGLDDVALGESLPIKTGWQDVFIVDEIIRGYTGEFQDFAECVLYGRKPQSDFELAYETTKLIYAAYLSAETGKSVDL